MQEKIDAYIKMKNEQLKLRPKFKGEPSYDYIRAETMFNLALAKLLAGQHEDAKRIVRETPAGFTPYARSSTKKYLQNKCDAFLNKWNLINPWRDAIQAEYLANGLESARTIARESLPFVEEQFGKVAPYKEKNRRVLQSDVEWAYESRGLLECAFVAGEHELCRNVGREMKFICDEFEKTTPKKLKGFPAHTLARTIAELYLSAIEGTKDSFEKAYSDFSAIYEKTTPQADIFTIQVTDAEFIVLYDIALAKFGTLKTPEKHIVPESVVKNGWWNKPK